MKKLLKRIGMTLLVWIAGLYIALALFALTMTDRVIFQPPAPGYRDTAGILKLRTADGTLISAVYVANPQAKYTILFAHGNAEDLGSNDWFFEDLKRGGFAVFAFDYHGYGTSQGKSSEAAVYQDIDAAYRHLTTELKTPPERIIVMGRSLGGAVAIDLASREKVGGLVVESSFQTAFRVLTRVPLLPWDKYPSIEKIKRVHCPVLVIHGTADSIIHVRNGRALFAAANEPKRSLWVERADHNDLEMIAGERFYSALREFSKLLD